MVLLSRMISSTGILGLSIISISQHVGLIMAFDWGNGPVADPAEPDFVASSSLWQSITPHLEFQPVTSTITTTTTESSNVGTTALLRNSRRFLESRQQQSSSVEENDGNNKYESIPINSRGGSRFLSSRRSKSDNNYYTDTLVDGVETKYNEYAQAWRLLGLYMDCTTPVSQEDNAAQQQQQNRQRHQRRRRLDDNGGGNDDQQGDDAQDVAANDDQQNNNVGDGNDDDSQGDDDNNNNNQAQADGYSYSASNYVYETYCQRYLLWAAYVDLGYQGDGLSYSYFNTETGRWDNRACVTLDSERCVRMDCHLKNSRFRLLGFFKQNNPVEWMETLFEHQGSCLWSYDEYTFMANSLTWLPQGCTDSGLQDTNDGNEIYFDLQPQRNGDIGIGLYSDNLCLVEYNGSITKSTVLQSYSSANNNNNNSGGGSRDYDKAMAQWNELMEPFKVCHPCHTYNLENAASGNDDGEDQGEDDAYDPNKGYFVCQDAAGDEKVNQCSLFQQNTNMMKASFRDVALASQQHTVAASNTPADVVPTAWQRYGFLLFSCLLFVFGAVAFCLVARKRKRVAAIVNNEPLLTSSTPRSRTKK